MTKPAAAIIACAAILASAALYTVISRYNVTAHPASQSPATSTAASASIIPTQQLEEVFQFLRTVVAAQGIISGIRSTSYDTVQNGLDLLTTSIRLQHNLAEAADAIRPFTSSFDPRVSADATKLLDDYQKRAPMSALSLLT